MKRLIRRRPSNAYLAANGTWAGYEGAHSFRNVSDALLALRDIKESVELVLVMGAKPNSKNDVVFPFGEPSR